MNPPKEPPYAYINRYYGVNVGVGMRVRMKSGGEVKTGIVVAKRSYDQYVHVRFDGMKFDVPVHPMELEYTC